MELSIPEKDIPSKHLSKVIKGHCTVNEDESNINGINSNNLHDSGFSIESQIPESGDGIGWFGGIGSDFLNCLTENVSPVVSGVATLVHKTAVAVANEISQLERDGELKAESHVSGRSVDDCVDRDDLSIDFTMISNSLTLPWEIRRDASYNPTVKDDDELPVYVTDKKLMKKMFALSNEESTFLQPFSDEFDDDEFQKYLPSSYCSKFVMDAPRIKLIHRILDVDENLASIHGKLTGGVPKSLETSFWKNYFFHCERVKADELCRRKNQNQMRANEIKPSCETAMKEYIACSPIQEDNTMKSAKINYDDESLVPVGSDIEDEQDDDSFVIQSPPNTGNTFATSRSIDDDIVLVDTHERMTRGE